MSQTTYVSDGGRGFYVYDVALAVFLKHLIDSAETSEQADAEWLASAVSDWRVSACISDYGLDVDESWSASQRETFVALAEEACRTLGKRVSISAEEIVGWHILEDLHIHPRGATEVRTEPVIELGRAVIALVKGELPAAPAGKAWLYGTENGREMLNLRSLP